MNKITRIVYFIQEYFPEREGFATAILPNDIDYAVVKLKNENEVRVFLEDDWEDAQKVLGSNFREVERADDFVIVSEGN